MDYHIFKSRKSKTVRKSTNGITITCKTVSKYKKPVRVAATVPMPNLTYGRYCL